MTAAGGAVPYRKDDISYLRVEVPIDRADEVAGGDGVEAAAVDVNAMSTRPSSAGCVTIRPAAANREWGAPGGTGCRSSDRTGRLAGPNYPITNAYSPAERSRRGGPAPRHPTYDGRGITIGHVEMGVDLLLPEFERAFTLDGQPAQKVADVRTAIQPGHTHGDNSRRTPWATMDVEVTATSGPFTAGDHRTRRRVTGAFASASSTAGGSATA